MRRALRSAGRALCTGLQPNSSSSRWGRLLPYTQHLRPYSAGRIACQAAAPAAPEAAPEAAAPSGDGNGAYPAGFKSQAYPFTEIEGKWQAFWEAHQTFKTPAFKDLDTSKPKFYALDMFPYPRWVALSGPRPPGGGQNCSWECRARWAAASSPAARACCAPCSGAGLHVGHPEGYTATDIISRYKRMKGFNVLHPMGWDAFGLPAEQYAIQTGTHPAVTTQKNINRFRWGGAAAALGGTQRSPPHGHEATCARRPPPPLPAPPARREQLQSLGFSYDWGREVSTCEPGYYQWTQWIFIQLLNAGLAYQAEVPVNWCPALGTVLANEEVVDGLSERGGHPVVRMPMRQWMLRITAYADRLLGDLEGVDWADSIKEMQRNWIGRSEVGAWAGAGAAGGRCSRVSCGAATTVVLC